MAGVLKAAMPPPDAELMHILPVCASFSTLTVLTLDTQQEA